jgi:hypothetical protein
MACAVAYGQYGPARANKFIWQPIHSTCLTLTCMAARLACLAPVARDTAGAGLAGVEKDFCGDAGCGASWPEQAAAAERPELSRAAASDRALASPALVLLSRAASDLARERGLRELPPVAALLRTGAAVCGRALGLGEPGAAAVDASRLPSSLARSDSAVRAMLLLIALLPPAALCCLGELGWPLLRRASACTSTACTAWPPPPPRCAFIFSMCLRSASRMRS